MIRFSYDPQKKVALVVDEWAHGMRRFPAAIRGSWFSKTACVAAILAAWQQLLPRKDERTRRGGRERCGRTAWPPELPAQAIL